MGRLLGEGLAQSFISSWIRLPLLFISLCEVLREMGFFFCLSSSLCLCFFLNAYISIFLSSTPLYFVFCSLLRMDEGECAARNSVHWSLLHWQSWLASSSVSDATRRLHSGFTQEGWCQTSEDEASSWLDSSESFCLSSTAKHPLDLTSTHCTTSHTLQDIILYFEFDFALIKATMCRFLCSIMTAFNIFYWQKFYS